MRQRAEKTSPNKRDARNEAWVMARSCKFLLFRREDEPGSARAPDAVVVDTCRSLLISPQSSPHGAKRNAGCPGLRAARSIRATGLRRQESRRAREPMTARPCKFLLFSTRGPPLPKF